MGEFAEMTMYWEDDSYDPYDEDEQTQASPSEIAYYNMKDSLLKQSDDFLKQRAKNILANPKYSENEYTGMVKNIANYQKPLSDKQKKVLVNTILYWSIKYSC